MKHLENKVNDQDTKIQGLEERLAQKTEVSVNCEIRENVCKVCEKVLQSQILLKKHREEIHLKKIQCQSYEANFIKNSELEKHLEEFHDQHVLYVHSFISVQQPIS